MKAIIINPRTKTVEEKEVNIKSFEDHYKIMDTDIIEPFRDEGFPGHCIWIDEEGLLKRSEPRSVIFGKYIVGICILLKGAYGTQSCSITLEKVKQNVRFL